MSTRLSPDCNNHNVLRCGESTPGMAWWPLVALIALTGCGSAYLPSEASQDVPDHAMLAGRSAISTPTGAVNAPRLDPNTMGGAGSGDPVSPTPAPRPTPSPTVPADCGPTAACEALPADIAKRWIAFDSDREAYNRDLYVVRADGSELTRLTKHPAAEREPTFAPDGRRLAYASNESGKFQIYIRDLASEKVTRLTDRAEGADQPNWSADGKLLVFHSGSAIFSIDATGQNEREIARGLDDFNAYKYPALTPDAKQVVFDRNNEINVIDIDGRNQRYVVQNWTTTEETPAVSPDGFNVAYAVSCGIVEQIAVVPLAGLARDPCMVSFATSAESGAARRPAWGPNGMLAYERGTVTETTGVRIALTKGPGSTPCDVVSGSGQNRNPTWAPEAFELP